MKKKSWIHKLMALMVYFIISAMIIVGVWYYLKLNDIDIESEVENFVANFETKNPNAANKEYSSNSISNPLEEIEDISVGSNKNQNEFFKDQLEPEAKKIYEIFQEKQEQMKTGNIPLDMGNSFTDLLNTATGEKKLGEYFQSAIEAYTYDHPEVFYLSLNKLYLNIETTTRGKQKTYRVLIHAGENGNYFADEFQNKQQVEEAEKRIQEIKQNLINKKSQNSFENIKMIHDYLVDTISYDRTLSKENIYNIYGALVQKESVCEGYAKAFKYLLDEFEIPCVIVIGKGTDSEGRQENHAWNYVQIEDNWYAVDVTWDDPILEGGGILSKKSKYQYFLKGAESFQKDHVASGNFTKGGKTFSYPSLKKEDY